jgi:hypothetical protein
MRQDTKYLSGEPTTEPLLVLDPFGIERIAWKPVVGCRGVFEKELRRAGDVVCALIRYEPGARTPAVSSSLGRTRTCQRRRSIPSRAWARRAA